MVPPEAVIEFAQEMTAAEADWQLHAYGNTMHAFTNPQANDAESGTVYDADADRRSWIAVQNFSRRALLAHLELWGQSPSLDCKPNHLSRSNNSGDCPDKSFDEALSAPDFVEPSRFAGHSTPAVGPRQVPGVSH